MKCLRVLGGPLQGEIKTVESDSSRYFDVPMRGEARWNLDYTDPLSHTFRVYRYESRKIQLGIRCAVDVLCPPGMTEAEMYRRLADVIEGVGERTRP